MGAAAGVGATCKKRNPLLRRRKSRDAGNSECYNAILLQFRAKFRTFFIFLNFFLVYTR